MKWGKEQQSLDRSDPTVARFVAECGVASSPVAIKLTGENEADLNVQIARLELVFGSLIHVTKPRRVSDDVTWVAHGTLMS